MTIVEHMREIRKKHSVTSARELTEFFMNHDDEFLKTLQIINDQNSWVYLNHQTYDGWYCVEKNKEWVVYEQERGGVCFGPILFREYKSAIAYLLTESGH